MNNLKSMLSKSSAPADAAKSSKTTAGESFDHLSVDGFFEDVMKAACIRASENFADENSTAWKTDANTFRAGASFALKWFSEKIG